MPEAGGGWAQDGFGIKWRMGSLQPRRLAPRAGERHWGRLRAGSTLPWLACTCNRWVYIHIWWWCIYKAA